MSSQGFPTRIFVDFDAPAPTFDVEEFDKAIRGHGVNMIHWRAMQCPVGRVDIGDGRQPHADHEGCSNGFIYTKAGVVTALFSGNSKDKKQGEPGMLDQATAQVTLPRHYDYTEEEIFVNQFDRLYLAADAVKVSYWENVRHSPDGRDKLTFPVEQVVQIVDAQGNTYDSGDFKLANGLLLWTGRRPTPDPSSGYAVYSIRYLYRPYWLISRIAHELRLVHAKDAKGEDVVVRAPQAVQVQREFVFLTQKNDTEAKAPPAEPQIQVGPDARQQLPTEYAGFDPFGSR